MTKLVCPSCGTAKDDAAFKPTPEERQCECGGSMVEPWKLKPRKPIRRVSEKKAASSSGPAHSTLKQGKGFSVTKAQREKVKGSPCVGCGHAYDWEATGAEQVVDPAHLLKRSQGGCDSPLCVIPLCRKCHQLYDAEELDLHGKLVDRGYLAEMAHPIEAHQISPLTLIQRLTGQEVQFGERGAGVAA